MPNENDSDLKMSEAHVRAEALIEQGIEAAGTGDLAAALEALNEAEKIAKEAEIVELVASARVNKGYAQWVTGNLDAARRLFAEAAEIAREAEDVPHLKAALVNFAVASRQDDRPDEAAAAYEEYLTLGLDDPADSANAYLECGIAHMYAGDFITAKSRLQEAARISSEAGLTELLVASRINEGAALERNAENVLALGCYQEAAGIARENELNELLATAVVSQAYAHRRLGDLAEAEPLFAEAEGLFRSLGKETDLANALYYHALTFKGMGNRDMALATWREEEPIRRRLEQLSDLGDCFFEQAGILRERDETSALEGLYLKAEDAYRRGDNARGLAETLLFHGRLLRAEGRLEDALGLAGQALSAATEAEAPSVECRVRGLRAMVLADSGDTSAAREDLDTAQEMSDARGLFHQTVWILARRAYVFAREGQPADEVAQQLRIADQYGTDHDLEALGRRAALRIISEISSNCGEDYAEELETLRAELRARKAEAAEPETQSSEASEVAAAQAAADD